MKIIINNYEEPILKKQTILPQNIQKELLDTNTSKNLIDIRISRRIVKFKNKIYKLLKIPKRTEFHNLSSGATIIERVFKNKKVITVSYNLPIRIRFKI